MNASFDCFQGSDGSKGEKGEVIFPGNPGSPGLRGNDVSKSTAQSDWYKKDGSVCAMHHCTKDIKDRRVTLP